MLYDYKFNLEEDQCKRIPCHHCGAVNCRGFMLETKTDKGENH
jgi:hypothetical protein